ncbi:MAG: Nif3-like dinuclear metal center hexameric protein [Cyclobacteriaceae bacterium]|nr:Nif3-like dinuclear metal center hexameric protein [Cyclobacteriaceae bacterium]
MTTVKIKDVTEYLETLAPRDYQESYDNVGLLTGQAELEVTGILVSLDCLEETVQEAVNLRCNLIVSHHPIIFKGLKKLTGSTYIERTVIQAIKNNIAIYAIHTNLDHVYTGVNRKICEKLGLSNLRLLSPRKDTLTKLVVFIPKAHAETVLAALHQAGAGQIGKYKNCSFRVEGTGSFMANEGAKPYLGEINKQESVAEVRAEVIFPSHLESTVMHALRNSHPYEEVAYYLTSLANENQEVGAGMVGELEQPMSGIDFLTHLKSKMNLHTLRHTRLVHENIKKVAVCGGSGSFLLQKAIQSGAQVFITADFKYHEFFDADGRIIIADIGHYESEVFTIELLCEELNKKFHTFAINFSKTVTNPISYF